MSGMRFEFSHARDAHDKQGYRDIREIKQGFIHQKLIFVSDETLAILAENALESA